MIFTTIEQAEILRDSGVHVVNSRGKADTMLIESAIAQGARTIVVACTNVDSSWADFRNQFEFVQAAGGLVLNRNNEILFIYRLEKWDLPKGKVEEGEALDTAAIREVEEECSLFGMTIRKTLCTTWHTYIQKGEPMLKATAWYLMDYDGNDTPEPQTIEGITEVKWLGLDRLQKVRKNTYPSVIDVIEEYTKL